MELPHPYCFSSIGFYTTSPVASSGEWLYRAIIVAFNFLDILKYHLINPFIGVRCALMALPEYIGEHPERGVSR